MAPNNRPRAREKKIIEGQGSVYRKGSGLDSKPLNTGSGGPSRPSGGGSRGGGGFGLGKIILILIMYGGRVGGLTLVFAATGRKSSLHDKFPTDHIAVG